MIPNHTSSTVEIKLPGNSSASSYRRGAKFLESESLMASLLSRLRGNRGPFLSTVKIRTAVGDHSTPSDGDGKDRTFGEGNVKSTQHRTND